MLNLTQRLTWGGRRGKKTCGIECTTCGNKRTLFSTQGAFTPAKVRFFFKFLIFFEMATELLFTSCPGFPFPGAFCLNLPPFLQNRFSGSGKKHEQWGRRHETCQSEATRPSRMRQWAAWPSASAGMERVVIFMEMAPMLPGATHRGVCHPILSILSKNTGSGEKKAQTTSPQGINALFKKPRKYLKKN